MTFQMGGLVSGMDTQSMIQQLLQIESLPIQKLQARQSNYQIQISKLGQLSAKLSDLQSAFEDVDTRTELLSLDASSSEDSLLKVTATGQANQGAYEVEISQLAKAEKDRSVAFASDLDPVKAGTLTIQIKDEDAVEITIGEGSSLRDVVQLINASDAEVSASIVNDGTNNYLFLSALETGHAIGGAADDAIVITESYTGATGTELAMTQTQQAQNSQFVVDGLAIEKETNSVSDVIDGLTLDLRGLTDVDTPKVAVTVTPDIESVEERIQTIVDAYNDILSFIESESKVTEGEDRETKLAGDTTVSSIRTRLQNLIGGQIEGLVGDYTTLGSIGITSGTTGSLQVDSDDLKEALQSDFLGVAKIFTTEDTGLAAVFTEVIEQFTDSYDGSIKLRKDGIQSRIDSMDDQIDQAERRLESYEQRLIKQYTAMESTMSSYQQQGNYLMSALG